MKHLKEQTEIFCLNCGTFRGKAPPWLARGRKFCNTSCLLAYKRKHPELYAEGKAERIRKLRDPTHNHNRGSNHPAWRGGISREPYPLAFYDVQLRQRILTRDDYQCRWCGARPTQRRNLTLHPVDYNKHNCKDENLLTLCRSCNGKVNKNREFWKTVLSPMCARGSRTELDAPVITELVLE